MRASEHWNVHRDMKRVGFVQAHTKIPLSTQQQEDEYTDVHKTNTSYKQVRNIKVPSRTHSIHNTAEDALSTIHSKSNIIV